MLTITAELSSAAAPRRLLRGGGGGGGGAGQRGMERAMLAEVVASVYSGKLKGREGAMVW
eukprot:COSAG05_NODE_5208_length_1235_cov_2.489437_1_plen_59_part_10